LIHQDGADSYGRISGGVGLNVGLIPGQAEIATSEGPFGVPSERKGLFSTVNRSNANFGFT
jgi:hypothetical protein